MEAYRDSECASAATRRCSLYTRGSAVFRRAAPLGLELSLPAKALFAEIVGNAPPNHFRESDGSLIEQYANAILNVRAAQKWWTVTASSTA
jgi:hypothetical protein